jgi:protocatechuate 3,4-dioxygenase beta subunit
LRDAAGRPVADRPITLADAAGIRTVTTDGGGVFRFDGLAAGTYVLRVAASPSDVVRNVWCNGLTGVTADVVLPPLRPPTQGGVISGTLRDPFGAPQAMRQILLTSDLLSRTISTDVRGQYRFDGLPAGAYTIHVEGETLRHSVYCDGNTAAVLDITLSIQAPVARAGVSGRLRDHGGVVVVDRAITLELQGAGLRRTVVTDSAGMYRFDDLPAGSYRIRVEGTDLVRSVWVDGRVSVVVDLMLRAPTTPAGLGRVAGTLRNPQGQPQAGRVVNLVGAGLSSTMVTDASGAYRFDGLAAATYLLSVPAAGVTRYVVSNGQTPTQLDLVIGR